MGIETAILGAAVSTAVGGTLAVGGFFGTFLGSFLVRAAVGIALNALTPKPRTQGANRGYQVNTRGSALDHQIIYGEARVGGAIIFEESVEGQTDNPDKDNQFLLRVYAHAGHEVEGYQDVYIDGKKVTEWRRADDDTVVSGPSSVPSGVPLVPYTVCDVTSNGVVILESEDAGSCSNRYAFGGGGGRANAMTLRFYDGSQTTADGALVADSDGKWNNNCVLNETAYMTAVFGFDPETYPNGVPEITCTIKGKKCFDPRTGTTYHTHNPALCVRDYLTEGHGLNEDSANIDDTLVATAADVCDEIVEEGINRYTCKGAFATSVAPADILSDMLTSMGGLLWYSQGKWRMKPAYWTTPSLTLTEDDLRSSISVKTRHSRRDNFNIVKGTFRGAETNWQVTDYPEVPKAGDPNPFLIADKNQESVVDLDLPFTTNSKIARRIARIFLERNRQQLTISASFGMRAFGLQVGDNVKLTLDRFGWDEKTFEVNSWTFGLADDNTLQVEMTLREISPEVFNDVDDGASFELDNTKLPDPFLAAAPTNLNATDGGFVGTDGTFVNSISVSWEVAKPTLVRHYVLEWKKSSATQYNSVELDTQNFDIPGVEDGVAYDIRVKSVNAVGVSSDYASINFTPGADTTAPAEPTSLVAEGTLGFINVTWVNPPDTDLKEVEVWEGPNGARGNATLLATVSGTNYNRGNLAPLTTRYYWVRAVDFSGNKSGFVGPVDATARQVTAADIGDAVIPYNSFASDVADLFDTIQADIGQLDADTVALESDVNTLENNFTTLDGEVSANNSAVSGLETRVTNAEGEITTNSSQITSLQSDLSNAESGISGNATAISGLDTRVTNTEGQISSQASQINSLSTTVGNNTTTVSQVSQSVDGIEGRYGVEIDNNGNITGYQLLSGYGGSAFNVRADQFAVFDINGNNGGNPFTIFTYDRVVDGQVFPAGTYVQNAYIDKASIVEASIDTLELAGNSVTATDFTELGTKIVGNGNFQRAMSVFINVPPGQTVEALILASLAQGYFSTPRTWGFRILDNKNGTLLQRTGMVATADYPTVSLTSSWTNTGSYHQSFTTFVDWNGEDAGIELLPNSTLSIFARWR